MYYYADNEVKNSGIVMSAGTAYPITFSKDGIYAASGHSIEKYAISEKSGELYLVKGVYVEYDEDSEHYTVVTEDGESEASEEDYQDMLDEYGESTIIHFAYGASDGCVNEITKK